MYELRAYDIRDKEQVIKLWIDICVEEHGFKDWEGELKNQVIEEYDEIIVAIYENTVIGTIAYRQLDNETAELKRLYINKEHRGKGIANKMLHAIMEKLKEKEYKKIFVETWKNFKIGRKFYERNNFMLQGIYGEVYNYILEL